MFSWQDFVRVLNKSSIEFEHLKIIQLSQAILESGRGESALFQRHANPYGMKYRREMHQIAVPMTYKASDGEDVYCKFDDLDDAVAIIYKAIGHQPTQNKHSDQMFVSNVYNHH